MRYSRVGLITLLAEVLTEEEMVTEVAAVVVLLSGWSYFFLRSSTLR
jgi:hypothetical protein